jgi:hypothetical protein
MPDSPERSATRAGYTTGRVHSHALDDRPDRLRASGRIQPPHLIQQRRAGELHYAPCGQTPRRLEHQLPRCPTHKGRLSLNRLTRQSDSARPTKLRAGQGYGEQAARSCAGRRSARRELLGLATLDAGQWAIALALAVTPLLLV